MLESGLAAAQLLFVTVTYTGEAPTVPGNEMVAVESVPTPTCAGEKLIAGEDATILSGLLVADATRGAVATSTYPEPGADRATFENVAGLAFAVAEVVPIREEPEGADPRWIVTASGVVQICPELSSAITWGAGVSNNPGDD